MTPEIALLDQLSHAPVPYLAVEGLIFGGERDFALATVLALLREGKIVVVRSGAELPVTTVEHWAGHPDESATYAGLGATTVDITETGMSYFLDQ